MSAFKLHTLKQKLWAIVAASFVARVVLFFTLPNTPSSLAPDEGTYASLAKWIAESKSASEFRGHGDGLYLSSRSVIIPASALVKFGMNELNAIRVTSSIFGFLSLCLLAYLCSKLLNSTSFSFEEKRKTERLVISLLLIYSFLPSHFVWSNLGLRESPNEFWLIMAFTGVFLLNKDGQTKKPLLAALVCISIICTFGSRPQVGWVLVVTLLIYSIFRLRNKLTYLLITSVLIGLFAGYLTTTSHGSERSLNLVEVGIEKIGAIPGMQIANQAGATSMIERLACPWEESTNIGKYSCLAFRAPFMTFTFLFRPLLFIDTTSLSSVFAATENMLWIFMFVLITYRISKGKRIPFLAELAPVLVFFPLYVVGAGSYEGNMGTAFRHKSLVLWIVLLLILITNKAIAERRIEKSGD